MLVLIVIIVALLFATDMRYLSFISGLVVGMVTIQVFYHRFNQVLPPAKAPAPPVAPNKLNSFAVQATPGRAWREILFMTALLVWSLYMLIDNGLLADG